MPTFDTPEPITVTMDLVVADVRIVASDRADTVVDVRPRDETKNADVNAARQTRVEFAGGRLMIKAPKGWRQHAFLGGGEAISVAVQLPTSSQVRGAAAMGTVASSGRLGECDFKIASGDLRFAQTGPIRLKASRGDLTVEHADGDAELTTSSGDVRIDSVAGAAVVKNSRGDTWIGAVAGDVSVNSAKGKVVVEHAGDDVAAKTAYGDVRVLDVQHGAVVAQTARGDVEIGVRNGVAAWLDLETAHGNVRCELDATDRPAATEDAVDVHARSAFGDITIRRASTSRAVSPNR